MKAIWDRSYGVIFDGKKEIDSRIEDFEDFLWKCESLKIYNIKIIRRPVPKEDDLDYSRFRELDFN